MKQALEKVQQTRKLAETEVAGDFRTRPGREMLRNQAKHELPAARLEFHNVFRKVGFPIFVNGPGASLFTDLALEQAEGLTVDFRKATKEIRDAVKGSIGNHREFTLSAFTAMLREVRQLAVTMGLDSIPNPTFEGNEIAKTEDDVDAVVDRYLLKYFGAEFLATALNQAAFRLAEDLTGDNPVVPVVILGVPVEMVDKLGPRVMQGKFTSVTAQADVDEKAITKTFKEIKTILKN